MKTSSSFKRKRLPADMFEPQLSLDEALKKLKARKKSSSFSSTKQVQPSSDINDDEIQLGPQVTSVLVHHPVLHYFKQADQEEQQDPHPYQDFGYPEDDDDLYFPHHQDDDEPPPKRRRPGRTPVWREHKTPNITQLEQFIKWKKEGRLLLEASKATLNLTYEKMLAEYSLLQSKFETHEKKIKKMRSEQACMGNDAARYRALFIEIANIVFTMAPVQHPQITHVIVLSDEGEGSSDNPDEGFFPHLVSSDDEQEL